MVLLYSESSYRSREVFNYFGGGYFHQKNIFYFFFLKFKLKGWRVDLSALRGFQGRSRQYFIFQWDKSVYNFLNAFSSFVGLPGTSKTIISFQFESMILVPSSCYVIVPRSFVKLRCFSNCGIFIVYQRTDLWYRCIYR